LASADVPGIGTVFLDGVAEEATMQRILQVLASSDNANSPEAQQRLATAANAAAGGLFGTGKQIRSLGSEADATQSSLGGLGRQARDMDRYISSVNRGFSSFGNTLNSTDPYSVSKGLISQVGGLAGAAISSLGGAMGPIGSVVGKLGEAAVVATTALAGLMVGALSKTTAEFNKMQQAGALFGGDLITTRLISHNAGLTMEQMSNVMAKSSKSMAMFGGQTTRGAVAFGNATRALSEGNLGNTMLRMGIGFEEMGVRTAEYMETLALSNTGMAQQALTASDVANGTARLAKQQKMMAALNGETIEAEKAKQKAVRQDIAFQAAIAKMDVAQRQEMEKMLAQYPAMGQAIKEMALTGQVASQQANLQMQAMGTAGDIIGQSIRNIRSGVDVGNQFDRTQRELEANAGKIGQERLNNADIVAQGMFIQGNAYIDAMTGQFNTLTDVTVKSTQKTYSKISEDMATLETAGTTATNAMVGIAKTFQKAQTDVSEIFTNFLEGPGGKMMTDAVATPIYALGAIIEKANEALGGKSVGTTATDNLKDGLNRIGQDLRHDEKPAEKARSERIAQTFDDMQSPDDMMLGTNTTPQTTTPTEPSSVKIDGAITTSDPATLDMLTKMQRTLDESAGYLRQLYTKLP